MKLSIAPELALSKLLSPASIALSLAANERDGVFAEMIARIPDLSNKPEARQGLLRALQERERLCSTGFGGGVALPHTRNSLVGLEHATIVFGRHLLGIPYGAMDNAPVKLLFLLVAPTVTQHLQILARLSRLLRNVQLRQDLLAVQSPEAVLAFLREAEERL